MISTGRRAIFFLFFIIIGLSSPVRSAEQRMSRQDYISRFKEEAVKEMHIYGIPASITLAQGILESGDGNSPLAREANNHFGIKCHKGWAGASYIQDDDAKNECFRKYLTPEESYRDHSEFLKTRQRYEFLFELKTTDYHGWAHGLKKAGYATNPKYPELLIKIIEDHKLHELDKVKPDAQAKKQAAGDKQPVLVGNKTGQTAEIKSGGLKVALNNNVKYIIARKNETPESLARELLMKPRQILNYNDLGKNQKIKEGDMIYLQPKRNKSDTKFHVVSEGENLRVISQKYGVKMSKLCAFNFLDPESVLHPGDKIYLRKQKN
jgi:hypothetical protein